MEGLVILLGILLVLFYFIPTIVANEKKHPQTVSIVVLNLFLGWTLIGWVIALAWAHSNNEPKQVIVQNPEQNTSFTDELVKLAELKDKGILTEEEFNAKKKQILEKE